MIQKFTEPSKTVKIYTHSNGMSTCYSANTEAQHDANTASHEPLHYFFVVSFVRTTVVVSLIVCGFSVHSGMVMYPSATRPGPGSRKAAYDTPCTIRLQNIVRRYSLMERRAVCSKISNDSRSKTLAFPRFARKISLKIPSGIEFYSPIPRARDNLHDFG